MSERQVTVTKKVCDHCDAPDAYWKCRECGADYCLKCREDFCVTYPAKVYFQGGHDGLYCPACDVKAAKRHDEVRAAFVAVKRLHDELRAFNADFNIRRESAEQALERVLKQS